MVTRIPERKEWRGRRGKGRWGDTEDLGPQRREGAEEEKRAREREEESKGRREGRGKYNESASKQ